MTVPVSLVKVGNSQAFIIPSKILKKMNVRENSTFELSFGGNSILQIRKIDSEDKLVFPKVAVPELTEEEMDAFMDGLVSISAEEIGNDERMAYILGR